MVLPVLVYHAQRHGLVDGADKLLAVGLVGFFQIHQHGEYLAPVSYGEGDVLVHHPFGLINVVYDGPSLADDCLVAPLLGRGDVFGELGRQLTLAGVAVELIVEAGVHAELLQQILLEVVEVKLPELVGEDVAVVAGHIHHVHVYALSGEGVAALGVDHLALRVHHVVVFHQVLADAEVVLLHLALGSLDALGEHGALQHLALLHTHTVHYLGDAFAAKEAHQVVFHRDEEDGRAGVSLTAGAAAQLTVHAAAVVPLRADDGQTAQGAHLVGELDVGASARHIGGDGHRALLSGVRHDLGLTGVLLGVEHLMGNAAHLEHPAQQFGDLHGGGAHQHGAPLAHEMLDHRNHGVVLVFLGAVDQVVLVVADHRTVGGYHHHVQLVYLPELASLSLCRTGHSGQLVIHPEVVLQGDGGKGLGGRLDLHVLLGLDRLVQAVAPAASLHYAAGLLVHYLDLAVDYHIVHILLEHRVCLEQLAHDVHTLRLEGVVGIKLVFFGLFLLCAERIVLLYAGDLVAQAGHQEEFRITHRCGQHIVALVGELHGAQLLVDGEIEVVGDDPLLQILLGEGVADYLALRVLQNHLDARLAQIFDQRAVFGQTLVGLEQLDFALVFDAPLADELLGLVQELVHYLALGGVELLHERLVFVECLICGALHRA